MPLGDHEPSSSRRPTLNKSYTSIRKVKLAYTIKIGVISFALNYDNGRGKEHALKCVAKKIELKPMERVDILNSRQCNARARFCDDEVARYVCTSQKKV